MFDEFNRLHDNRESDSIQYFSFYDSEGNLIRGSLEASLDDNGQFDILTQIIDDETVIIRRNDVWRDNNGRLLHPDYRPRYV